MKSHFCRRVFLKGAAAAAALAPLAASAASPLDGSRLVAMARELARRNARRIKKSDIVALADFSAPSWSPRFHLVDIERGEVKSMLTAHGRGSDPRHTGWLKTFSNAVGSYASSSGAYLTGAQYDGKYGRAMRLTGLDPENSNADRRAIVIHSAWYVSDDMIGKYGKLGRSEGCFALSETGLKETLDALGPGRLLYAGKLQDFIL